MINNFNIILPILVILFLIGVLYFLQEKRVNFSIRVLIGLIFGVLIGSVFKEKALIIEPIGKVYVALIKMIVIPLVMVSLISSITNLKNIEELKSIGVKTILLLLLTTGIASIVGILVGNVFNVGHGLNFVANESFKLREIPSFNKVLIDMLPSNPILAMTEGKIIPVIIFSLFISIAILKEEARNLSIVKPFKDFISSLNTIFISITKIILKFTPYGVLALISVASANNGVNTLMPLLAFIVAVYFACLIQIFVVHSLFISLLGKVNPIKFLKHIYPAQVVAFTTQSSYGTLPITIKSLVDNAKISKSVATFVASLGSTMGMNACGGLYPAIVAIFVANVFNIELTLMHYIILVLTTIIASIGMAGVPGAATISTTVVLSGLGLPIEGMAMVLGVDAIIDMMRTLTNVTGTSVVALIVNNINNKNKQTS